MADERQIKDFVVADSNISFSNTDQEILDYINEKSETRWNTVTSAQIYEAIVPADFPTDAAKQVRVDRILGLSGNIATAPGAQARAELINIFGAQSATITTLAAIASEPESPGQRAGLGVEVFPAEIARARAL